MAATQEKCDVVDSWEDIDENEVSELFFLMQIRSSQRLLNEITFYLTWNNSLMIIFGEIF